MPKATFPYPTPIPAEISGSLVPFVGVCEERTLTNSEIIFEAF